jgi:hypothetical protein
MTPLQAECSALGSWFAKTPSILGSITKETKNVAESNAQVEAQQ